ncbi:MAG: LuxR C-terminal-related transcriptional regulator [Burkholderiaceae bacterium]
MNHPHKIIAIQPLPGGHATQQKNDMLTPANARDPALALKATPPRATKGFQEREQLSLDRIEAMGASVVALLAPAGFGKTAQLVQWRREALSRGALAFWLTADERDEPHRFVQGLTYAARELSGRRGFDASFLDWLNACTDSMSAITGWLAEVSSLAVDVLLVIDDAERLPALTRTESLTYLLGNAPANLHIALGARPSGALAILGTLNKTRVTQITASELRFSQEETTAFLSNSLGNRCTPDLAIRLHELAEGWPLGVQMAVSALHGISDPQDLLTTATQDIRKYFIDKLIDLQPADTLQMLVRMADFEVIHPDLCRHALGSHTPTEELSRLRDESPLFVQAEGTEWMRFHPIARDALRERLQTLPPTIRSTIATAASVWYAEHRLFQEAAQMLRSAGDHEGALRMVEQCMREMITQGQSAAVIEWIQSLSHQDIDKHPDLWLPAAWAFAMSERPAHAQPLLDLIAASPAASMQDRFELELIKSAAATYADDFEIQSHVLANWSEPPAGASPQSQPIFWTAKAMEALLSGKPDQARLHFSKVARLDRSQAYTPSAYGFVDCGIALTYLWEGRYTLAEQTLRPALTRAEERMERRSPIACLLAALLANVCWEQGKIDEANALLALRLDVIERHGLPDVLISAHDTMAGIADAGGRQDQALELLDALNALGETRNMSRLRAAAQLGLIELHVKHGRPDTAERLSHCLNLLVKSQSTNKHPTFSTLLALSSELARAHVGLAVGGKEQLSSALQAAQAAMSLADSIKRGSEGIQARILRAHAMRRLGFADAPMAMDDATSLAEAAGMVRLLADLASAHAKPAKTDRSIAAGVTPARTADHSEAHITGTALLTTKERDALLGLVRGLSNKEIALSMGVSEQTIKWHMKNLFSKLNAASRKHAVARANMLGLINN